MKILPPGLLSWPFLLAFFSILGTVVLKGFFVSEFLRRLGTDNHDSCQNEPWNVLLTVKQYSILAYAAVFALAYFLPNIVLVSIHYTVQ